MVLTFLDLWKQWQGANQNLPLDTGAGVLTVDAQVLATRGQCNGDIHTFGLRALRDSETLLGPRQRGTPETSGIRSRTRGLAPGGSVFSSPGASEPARPALQALLTPRQGQDARVREPETW